MKTVKVLVDGVGDYNAGDVVRNAPDGLVEIAISKTRNAASGQLLAEMVGGGSEDVADTERLQFELDKTRKALAESQQREEALRAQVDELSKPPAGQTGEDLDVLKAKAKELKIKGYVAMSADELHAAIEAAGGDGDAK
ncbi:hypothetical protein [Saccharibacillus brassicae]|uniref:Uncharacterized protein n=1 Tax=Saccharibacillus brassicae TaxID=2583377 RepID=A0A4Y6V0B4_SACBS|nr:hypothetical protein [Saccharibacillus brassicae]QDH23459.1 hypothetical protein FFV09_22890 [Saccharibacillus brassicae]